MNATKDKPTHSPGPWIANRTSATYGTIDWEIISPRSTDQPSYNLHEKRVATLQTDDGETMANAHLIAAAPELLAACGLGLGALVAYGLRCESKGEKIIAEECRVQAAFVRAAIEKARGE